MKYVRTVAVAAAVTVGAIGAQAGPVLGQGSWEATLLPRDINGDGQVDAFYDTVLNVTWLADWNSTTQRSWFNALAWAADLDVFGVTGWRLPKVTDVDNDGCSIRSDAGGTDCGQNVITNNGSEMAHLWYVTLGNKAGCTPGDTVCATPQPGWGLSNTAQFIDLTGTNYWSGTEDVTDLTSAWSFYTYGGDQITDWKTNKIRAVAVRDGDIVSSVVPEPSVLSLTLIALVGLAFAGRRRYVKTLTPTSRE